MRRTRHERAFTLIEVLVVVAIIAVLVAILLPSLARARAQSRMVVCQSNVRQVLNGFQMYVVEFKGRLPGFGGSGIGAINELDWLGASNSHGGQPTIYGPSGKRGRMPEWGTIYKYMNKQKFAFMCPDDRILRTDGINSVQYYSYTANLLLNGAKPEGVSGAHYPLPLSTWPTSSGLNRLNHRVGMATMDGVPLLVEEHEDYFMIDKVNDDSRWCSGDTITARHLPSRPKRGYGNIGYVDGHVGRLEAYVLSRPFAPAQPPPEPDYLQANYFCIRRGKTWVSGRSWYLADPYRFMDSAPQALTEGVQHN